MKILVAVKRVVDYNVKVRVKADNSGVDLANVKMSMNPFCEIAVEEAVRLKEQGIATEVVVVTVGTRGAQEQLRTALALGADRATLVETNDELNSLAVAKLLKALVDQEQPQLVILGKQAIDSDNNQTGQMLGALTGYAQGTFASKVELAGDKVNVTREIDGGLQTVALNLPAIRIIQANNQMLIDKFYTIRETTVPTWKRQFMLALALNEQRNAVELADTIDDTTNELLRRNAQLLHQNAVATAKANQRLVIDVETLQQCQNLLVQTVGDVIKIQRDGVAERAKAEKTILDMRSGLAKLVAGAGNKPTARELH
ncbi:TPA: toxic anion resistance protein [Pseudomonas aeruginosa]|nr:toxic anion resistance protein [Pseudomonas aeruginosa]